MPGNAVPDTRSAGVRGPAAAFPGKPVATRVPRLRNDGEGPSLPCRTVELRPSAADLRGVRIKIAAVVLLLCGVGFVLHERKTALERRLGDVATQLGRRHVHVHCQSFAANLVDVSAEAGSVRFGETGVPYDYTDLKRPICQALKRYPHDLRSAGYGCVLENVECPQRYWEDALAVHTLAHEVWHLHGITSEALAECDALQTTAQAAALLGADPRAAQATAVYALTHFYPNMPDEYRQLSCVDGGPNDLRPADRVWP
jgi:hypothetical protein